MNNVHKFGLFIVVSILLSLTASVLSQDNPVDIAHIVIEIEGTADIEYLNGSISRLTVGTLVRPQDIVRVGVTDRVVILCADLSVDQIARSSRAPNCSATISDPIWQYQGFSVVDRQRSTGYENIPYIITPRNTNLLTPNPTIRWNAIDDAASYTVSVFMADGTLLWEETGITETELVYPERHPYLRALDNAGEALSYDIFITAFDASNREIATPIDPGIQQSISILAPNDRPVIETKLRELRESNWTQSSNADMVAYSTAFYLFNQNLYGDALEQLLPLVASSGTSAIKTAPPLYLLLGDIYLNIKLPIEAIANYERAVELASEQGDLISEAQALSGLGSLSSGEEANEYYSQAITIFRDLGEDTLADELAAKLN